MGVSMHYSIVGNNSYVLSYVSVYACMQARIARISFGYFLLIKVNPFNKTADLLVRSGPCIT